jgi:hypothetical protein
MVLGQVPAFTRANNCLILLDKKGVHVLFR